MDPVTIETAKPRGSPDRTGEGESDDRIFNNDFLGYSGLRNFFPSSKFKKKICHSHSPIAPFHSLSPFSLLNKSLRKKHLLPSGPFSSKRISVRRNRKRRNRQKGRKKGRKEKDDDGSRASFPSSYLPSPSSVSLSIITNRPLPLLLK